DLFAHYTRDWFCDLLERRLPHGTCFSRANLEALILAAMEALAELNDHCQPIETLKPLVMSAVQEELSLFLLGWLQQAPSDAVRRSVGLETTAAGVSWWIFGTALA